MGSWIGGDRDGNPFVTADALRQALLLQSKHALGFYLDELHCLGAELSLDGRYVNVSDEVQNLAASPTVAPPSASLQRSATVPSSARRFPCAPPPFSASSPSS